MGKVFESYYEFCNYCKAILVNKGNSYFLDDNMECFKELCSIFYDVNKYSYKLEDKNLMCMTDIFIKLIDDAKCQEDIKNINETLKELVLFILDDNSSKEKYTNLYKRFEKSSDLLLIDLNKYLSSINLISLYKDSVNFIDDIIYTFGKEIADKIIDKSCYKVNSKFIGDKENDSILLVDFDRLYTIFKLLDLETYFDLVVYKKYKHNIKYFAHNNMWNYYGFEYLPRNIDTLLSNYSDDYYEIIDIGKDKKLVKLSDKVDVKIELNDKLLSIPNIEIVLYSLF